MSVRYATNRGRVCLECKETKHQWSGLEAKAGNLRQTDELEERKAPRSAMG